MPGLAGPSAELAMDEIDSAKSRNAIRVGLFITFRFWFHRRTNITR